MKMKAEREGNVKPTEQEYLYKIEIEMDDKKILADNEYDIDEIYQTIREFFAEENIMEITNDRGILIFASCKTDNKEFARFGYIEKCLVQCEWFKRYVKRMTWFDKIYGDVSEENVLKVFGEYGLI